ncbi:MAG: amino acid-binding ACT domain-containing protein [Anaerolineales bacterium]|nr:MAG: amino acid-binding ACT domain-containing protein [Anaerolineales bacterium]
MDQNLRYGWDLTVRLEHKLGTLAALGEALGADGVNIDGICGVTTEGEGLLHLLVEDPEIARRSIEKRGFDLEFERRVLLVDIINQPGELGGIARRLADAGLSIDLLYLTAGMDLVIGVEPLEQASAILRA